MLPYDQLQILIANLRFPDETALKTIGLAKLAKAFDAYPVVEGGRRTYCLLPKGMEASKARQLAPSAARQQIIVLREEGQGLVKVWPGEPGQEVAATPPAKVAAAPKAKVEPAAAAEPAGPLGELEFVEE